MKKTILSLLIFLVATVNGCCVPQILDLAYSDSANLFDKYEISFNLTLSYINPYDPDIVDVSAEFTSPTGNSFSVCGFYYEGYTSVMQDSDGTRYIPLTFPSCIRDIPNNAINNVLGDAVFAIYKL